MIKSNFVKLAFCICLINTNTLAGMDLYSGPIATYMSGNWEPISQQYCKAVGMKFAIDKPSGDKSNSPEESIPESMSLGVLKQRKVLETARKYSKTCGDTRLLPEISYTKPHNFPEYFKGDITLDLVANTTEHPEVEHRAYDIKFNKLDIFKNNKKEILKFTESYRDDLFLFLKTQKESIAIKKWDENINGNYKTTQFASKFMDYIETYTELTGKNIEQLTYLIWLPIKSKHTFKYYNLYKKPDRIGTSQGLIEAINELSKFYFKKEIHLLREDDRVYQLEGKDGFYLSAQLLNIYDICNWSLESNYPIMFDY